MKPRNFPRLTAKQWVWLPEAFVRLGVMRLRLRFGDPAVLAGKLSFSRQPDAHSEQHTLNPDIPAMHESVRLAARCHPGKVDCLPRSLVLTDMLKGRAHTAQTVLGVVKHEGNLAAHAWVEVNGMMVAEAEAVSSKFSRLVAR